MLALGQKVRLLIADRVLEYPELAMEFEVNFDTGSDGNTGSIKLYNLSEETINLFKKDQLFTLSAGYRDDVGMILPGVIVLATTAWEGTEKITSVTIGDCTDRWLNATVNMTWRAGMKASEVAKDVTAVLGIGIGSIQVAKDVTYTRGKTFSCTCKRALEELARDLGLKLHVSRGKVYLKPPESGLSEIVDLNSASGLMGSPEKLEDNTKPGKCYQVQSLLNYRLQSDAVLQITSKTIEGLWRVEKGRHVLNGEDFYSELEVVKYGA